MEVQLLALVAQTVIMAVLAVVAVHFWFCPTDINKMEGNVVDSDGNENENFRDVEESAGNEIDEEEIDESEDSRKDFASFTPDEEQKRIYMEEMWEMAKEQRKNEEMKDMNKKLEIKLMDAREMELLRKMTTESERQMTAICKGAQDQWFGIIEACKHSVYVNNLNLGTSRKELKDHFASCGTITTIEFCKDTVNYRFIGMSSARIEFIDISAKLKALDLTGTLLKGNKIDVTNVPAPIARYRSRRLCYRWFNNRQY
ncbi:unnamed protein product [Cercopithifilaria johnstoni]|uniref:RRM domain-containing protein n=1 Tax=Cercopithifilaria johnstoni TaxID=2874296 RepID=A0A8J2LTA7_9BILA|nr:unnamed protein product [Cercopithifilaria johnstoni]